MSYSGDAGQWGQYRSLEGVHVIGVVTTRQLQLAWLQRDGVDERIGRERVRLFDPAANPWTVLATGENVDVLVRRCLRCQRMRNMDPEAK